MDPDVAALVAGGCAHDPGEGDGVDEDIVDQSRELLFGPTDRERASEYLIL